MTAPIWLTTHAEFAAIAPAWDAALTASGSDNPFLLSDFLATWCAAFVPDGNLRILVFSQGETIVGGWPLYWTRRRRWPILRMVGIGFANLTEPFFTSKSEAFARACGQALGKVQHWRYLNLPLVRAAWLPQAAGIPQLARATSTDARIRLDRDVADAAAYLATLRPKMQANVHRCLRLAEVAGGATLRRESDPAAIAGLIQFQLRHNGPDRYPPDTVVTPSRPAWTRFTQRVLEVFAASGRLDAMALRVGGELAAVGFGFRHGPGYKSVLTSYDPRFRSLGPGFLLFHHLIDWCIRNGDPYLEMYGDGRALDKRRWCNEFEPLYTLRLFPPGLLGRGLRAGFRLWHP